MYSYVARQPILDSKQDVIAYELLFRDGKSNSFPNINPDQATSNILTNNHLTMGVEEVTGDLPAYINFHEDALIKHFPSFLDPQKVVIEILEDVPASDALLETCISLKSKGYKLALDDHDFDPKWQRFLPYIDIIKIDVLAFSILKISQFVRELNDDRIELLAEKVETAQQFSQLKMLGFSAFQGYFFAKPETIKQKRITTSEHSVLELIAQASQVKLDFDKMSQILSRDPGLTYKLLRFINSPTYGRSQEITSLKHALIYIGDVELKKFIALLALSDLNKDKPSEIMVLSLVRAKFCERISTIKKDQENPPKAFLTGILSLVDGILDCDLASVLEILPIHQEIKAALLHNNNYLAGYLRLAKRFEGGMWQDAEQLANELGLNAEECLEAHQQAIFWSDDMLRS